MKKKKQIYNTDFLFNNNFNNNVNNNPILNPDPNINYNNPNIYYNNLLTSEPNVVVQPNAVVQPVAPPIIYDPIENYDRLKLLDPLVDPRGRSSADQIPTPQVAVQLNFPTQGILDRYHRVGLLIAINKHDCKNNRRRNSYENFNGSDTDSYEDFGNIEKIVKGNKVNVDSDVSSSNVSSSDNCLVNCISSDFCRSIPNTVSEFFCDLYSFCCASSNVLFSLACSVIFLIKKSSTFSSFVFPLNISIAIFLKNFLSGELSSRTTTSKSRELCKVDNEFNNSTIAIDSL